MQLETYAAKMDAFGHIIVEGLFAKKKSIQVQLNFHYVVSNLYYRMVFSRDMENYKSRP